MMLLVCLPSPSLPLPYHLSLISFPFHPLLLSSVSFTNSSHPRYQKTHQKKNQKEIQKARRLTSPPPTTRIHRRTPRRLQDPQARRRQGRDETILEIS